MFGHWQHSVKVRERSWFNTAPNMLHSTVMAELWTIGKTSKLTSEIIKKQICPFKYKLVKLRFLLFIHFFSVTNRYCDLKKQCDDLQA